jgi:NAD(P)-dependent dehydrogenase (short-subunit alcohol dehydrogenase family)
MNGFDFAGQSVVVTGGTRGIGAGIASAFLAAGANVMVCGRTEPDGWSNQSSGRTSEGGGAGAGGSDPAGGGRGAGAGGSDPAGGGRRAGRVWLPTADGRSAHFWRADVRDPEQAGALVRVAVELFGRLDVLISNAGGAPPADAATVSPRFHAKVIELNLIAPLHVAQSANAVMQDQPGGGSIIMIGSVSGTRPSPGTAAYGAAKAGLHSLATSLAVEWAPRVRVNCVVPSLVVTPAAQAHNGSDAGLAAVAATVPLGRVATPADVAAACLFLASSMASYVSGSALLVHGGGELPAFLAALGGSVYPRSEQRE